MSTKELKPIDPRVLEMSAFIQKDPNKKIEKVDDKMIITRGDGIYFDAAAQHEPLKQLGLLKIICSR